MDKIIPKAENANKGFDYEIDEEMLQRFQTWTPEQRMDWVFETADLILSSQTPAQRAMMERLKNEDNGFVKAEE